MEVVHLPPGDPRLVDAIVSHLKSKGIFDKFRKECLADVDTKPAFQNLRQRVDSQVKKYLGSKVWRNDLNKNHFRDGVRKNIQDSGILDSGIDAIINQVVNPKIKPLILPYVEDTVYAFLKIDKPSREIYDNNTPSSGPPLVKDNREMPLKPPPLPFYAQPPHLNEVYAPQPRPSFQNYQEPPPLRPEFHKQEPQQEVAPMEVDNIKEVNQSLPPPPLLHESLALQADVISSSEDDIELRKSDESRSSSMMDTNGDNLKIGEENAVDSFDTARREEANVVEAVEKLSIKGESEEPPVSSTDSPVKEVFSSGPLFHQQSLDSISSNSSGLSSSPSDDKKSVPVEEKVSVNDDNSDKSLDSVPSQSTPLRDEKSYSDSSPVDSSKSWKPYTLPKSLSSTERTTVSGFQPLVSGASPVSAENSQDSFSNSSDHHESSLAQLKEETSHKAPREDKSEGEITSSTSRSSSLSPDSSKDAAFESASIQSKGSEASKDKNTTKFGSDSDSSREANFNENEYREEPPKQSKERDNRYSKEKDHKSSKSKHDDHSSHRDKYKKHHTNDKDDDGDKDRKSKSHSHSSYSSYSKGVSTTDSHSKDKEKSVNKSHSSTHSSKERRSSHSRDKSHSSRSHKDKHKSSSHSSKHSEKSKKSEKSESKGRESIQSKNLGDSNSKKIVPKKLVEIGDITLIGNLNKVKKVEAKPSKDFKQTDKKNESSKPVKIKAEIKDDNLNVKAKIPKRIVIEEESSCSSSDFESIGKLKLKRDSSKIMKEKVLKKVSVKTEQNFKSISVITDDSSADDSSSSSNQVKERLNGDILKLGESKRSIKKEEKTNCDKSLKKRLISLYAQDISSANKDKLKSIDMEKEVEVAKKVTKEKKLKKAFNVTSKSKPILDEDSCNELSSDDEVLSNLCKTTEIKQKDISPTIKQVRERIVNRINAKKKSKLASTNTNNKSQIIIADVGLKELESYFEDSDSDLEFEGFGDQNTDNGGSDFEGFDALDKITADERLKNYLAEFTLQSSVNISSVFPNSSDEESSTCKTVFSKKPIENDNKMHTRKRQLSSDITETICKRTRIDSTSLIEADTILDGATKRVLVTSYSLPTPDEDRTSNRDFDIELMQQNNNTYRPLSPSSDSSEDTRARRLRSRRSNANNVKVT